MLIELQHEIVDYLDLWDCFDGIPIITEDLGDLTQLVNLALGRLGQCAFIKVLPGGISATSTPAVQFDRILVTVTIVEYVTLNRTVTRSGWQYAQDLAEKTLAILLRDDFKPHNQCFIGRDPAISPAVTQDSDPGLVAWNVNLQTSGGFRYIPRLSATGINNKQLLNEIGIPILDETGVPILVEPPAVTQQVPEGGFIPLLDETGNQILDELGNPVLVEPPPRHVGQTLGEEGGDTLAEEGGE